MGVKINNKLFSVIILSFNNFQKSTKLCIDSLIPWLDDPEVEIIVLDNGSIDGSSDQMLRYVTKHPQLRVICSEQNLGYSGGMNLASTYAKGKWLLLVNSDAIFPAAALNSFKRVIRNLPSDIAMVAPTTNSAGNGQQIVKKGLSKSEYLHLGEWIHQNPTDYLIPTYRCDFFTVAIRSKVWMELGGLDIQFNPGYFEDFDFCLRASKAGYKQKISEDVFVYHSGSASFAAFNYQKSIIRRNQKLLLSKHSDAQLIHARVCNYNIIEHYFLKIENLFSEPWRERVRVRLDLLKNDLPRSPIKRFLWKIKISKYVSRIDQYTK